jgi:hypothetical protein
LAVVVAGSNTIERGPLLPTIENALVVIEVVVAPDPTVPRPIVGTVYCRLDIALSSAPTLAAVEKSLPARRSCQTAVAMAAAEML